MNKIPRIFTDTIIIKYSYDRIFRNKQLFLEYTSRITRGNNYSARKWIVHLWARSVQFFQNV